MQVAIESIQSGGNVRFDENDITTLAASIERQGLIQPIVVLANGEGYTILAGHRRFAAVSKLGWGEIEVVVNETVETDADRIAAQFAENVQRKDLSAYEQAQATLELKEQGLNQGAVAEELEMSVQDVSQFQKVARTVGGLPNATVATKLSKDALFELVDMADEFDDESQALMIENTLRELTSGNASSVRQALGAAERETKQAAAMERIMPLLDELAAQKITVLTEQPDRSEVIARHAANGLMVSGDLASSEKWVLLHRQLDCHAIRIHKNWSGIELHEYCLKPMSHREKGRSGLKEASADEKQSRRDREKAERKAAKEAKQLRIDAVKDKLTGKWTQKDVLAIADTVLSLPADAVKAVGKALELEPTEKYQGYKSYDQPVADWIAALPASKQPVVKILMLAGYVHIEDRGYGATDYTEVFES